MMRVLQRPILIDSLCPITTKTPVIAFLIKIQGYLAEQRGGSHAIVTNLQAKHSFGLIRVLWHT